MMHNRGSILVIVLWISFGLVSIALLFGHSMMLEYRSADNAQSGLEATCAVEGARRYVEFVLGELEEAGDMPDEEEYEMEWVEVGDTTFWLLGRDDDSETGGEINSGAEIAFGLVDEARKLNLNTATSDMLASLPGMTLDLAEAIIDWRDSDTDISGNGAESETYMLLDTPYHCKDSAFETLEELRLVAGADLEILYGEDTNRNGILDSHENDGDETLPEDNGDGILQPGIIEYLTVYSREPNKQSDGTPRVNINNDENGQLGQVLGEKLSSERAQQIQAQAGSGNNFRSVLEFYLRSGMTPDEFALVDDALTISDEAYLQGLVNVNTACAEVLTCLPGMDEEKAEMLVAFRQGKTDELETLAWIVDALEPEEAIAIAPYLTTRCYQFTADAAAVGHLGRGFRRVQFIFDASGDEPIVVYRKDLTRLGWPLGAEVREELVSQQMEETQPSL
jgi:type II secretory pathway component PulK